MRGNMRAEVSLSCLLLAFEFGSRSEPEFVASTVRPARIVPKLIRLCADHLFIRVHVMFSKHIALASQTEASGAHQRSSRWPLALTYVEQAGKIAEHGSSRPASLEIYDAKRTLGEPTTPAFVIAAFSSSPPSQVRAFATSETS